MNKWIDISQPLTNDNAHWPRDIPFSFKLTYTKEQTSSVNVGHITTSLHNGTHLDAPFHVHSTGKTIDELNINCFIGTALVVDVHHTNKITTEHLEKYNYDDVKHVLLRTSFPNSPKRFPKQIPFIDPTIAPFLHKKGIVLLGVDLPSVDPLDSKALATHHALNRCNIHILENIILGHVTEGLYTLIALPLAIQGADASPTRAVLQPLEKENNV
ncbi:MAG TPA: arylformamidase [Bacillota bacterium]